jgi:PAS domain S-box-containing protein
MLDSLCHSEGPESHYREVTIGSHIFGEYIYLSRELGVVRLYAVDITERRRAEEALRLSQEKYAASFANNPAVITLTRLEDGVYLEVNDTWVAMTGYSREEAIGHSARKMPIWPTQDDAARFVQEIREKGFVRGREQEFRKKSGEAFLVEMSSQILTIQGEKVILSTMVDITEQHHAEEALRASEALARNRLEELEAIYKTAPVGLCLLDKNLRWVRINDTLAHMNGFPVAAHIGKTPRELIPDFGEQAEAAMRKVLETGEPLNIELTGTTPAQPGVIRSFEEQWLPWMDQQGNIVGISVAREETTERKRMEAALLSSEENLRLMVNEASDAMVVLDPGGVIQAVSHLGAQLLGYAESELIGKSAERLAETFSRLEVALKLEDLRTHAPRPVTTSVYVRTKSGTVQLFSVKVRSVGLGTKAEKYFIKFAGVDLPGA